MRRTGLEEGWRAPLDERPWVEEHGERSRRREGRKQTCYDFDDGATRAVGRGGVIEEDGTNMENKHAKSECNIGNSSKIKTQPKDV